MMVLKILGLVFFILAILGTIRLKDPIMRLSAISLASGMGVFFLLLAAALNTGEWIKATLTFLLISISSALGGHVISRSLIIGKRPKISHKAIERLHFYQALANKETRVMPDKQIKK